MNRDEFEKLYPSKTTLTYKPILDSLCRIESLEERIAVLEKQLNPIVKKKIYKKFTHQEKLTIVEEWLTIPHLDRDAHQESFVKKYAPMSIHQLRGWIVHYQHEAFWAKQNK